LSLGALAGRDSHAHDRQRRGKSSAKTVQFLLDSFPEATGRWNGQGRLPLHSAIRNGADHEVVRALVKARPEAISDLCGSSGLTPARLAALTTGPQQLEVLRYLLEVDEQELSTPDGNGRMMLHDAVEAGASAGILTFLWKGYPQAIASKDHSGKLPVHLLGLKATLEAARFLVESSESSLWACDQSERPPLHAALVNGAPMDVLKFLMDKCEKALKIKDKDGYLPLHHAINEQESFKCVTLFVTKWPGAVQVCEARGWLAIHVAVARRWPVLPVVEFLVKQWQSSLRMEDNDGSLPLHVAVAHSAAMDVLGFLLVQYPGAIEKRNHRRNLPLHLAVAAKHAPSLKVTQFIVAKFPDAVRTRGANGRFALHIALAKKKGYSAGIARFVLEEWPDAVREPYADGRLPIHKALRQDHQAQEFLDLVKRLVELYPESLLVPGPDKDLPLHAALSLKQPSEHIVRHLVEQCPESVAAQDSDGRTPLHLALRHQGLLSFDLVQHLVRHGGPGALQKADHHRGFLPLHVALSAKRTFTLRYAQCLAKAHPASLQVPDKDGCTPLFIAATSNAPLDVVHFLLVAWPSALLDPFARTCVPPSFSDQQMMKR
jgi:ankyrin repeat protein